MHRVWCPLGHVLPELLGVCCSWRRYEHCLIEFKSKERTKEALDKRQRSVWVQALGFQGLCLRFFVQVFTEQEYISSASPIQISREKFPGNFGLYSSHFGRAQERCTIGKWDFWAGICGSKGTALMVEGVPQHHCALGI